MHLNSYHFCLTFDTLSFPLTLMTTSFNRCFLLVGVGKSRELVLVKTGGCSLLPVGVGKIDECNLDVIKEIHSMVFSHFGFPHKIYSVLCMISL